MQLTEKIDDASGKARARNGIAEGQAESGDVVGAAEWARKRTSPEARADALFGVVRAISRR